MSLLSEGTREAASQLSNLNDLRDSYDCKIGMNVPVQIVELAKGKGNPALMAVDYDYDDEIMCYSVIVYPTLHVHY